MSKYLNKITSISLLVTVLNACIEPFEAQIVDFESAVVVEATLTNQTEQHEVLITRTFKFEEEGSEAESGASVRVVGGNTTYTFSEVSPGRYIADQAFAAISGVNYQLIITTKDGRNYSSNEVTLTQETQIDDLRAERITLDDGREGVAILVDSFDPTRNSINYRYEYEETYKIIAPFWRPLDLRVPENASESDCDLEVVQREQPEQVCFTTNESNTIIITNTGDLEEDRVDNFLVRFIDRDNFIISHRYSILVRQFVQSNEAFSFYKTLREFSGNQSLFSETQPGFLEGNISSTQDENELVMGYFEVSSTSEQRIFFNYEDLFPNEPLPPYIIDCSPFSPPLVDGIPPQCILRPQVEMNFVRYFDDNPSPGLTEGPFLVVLRTCGDCTTLGSTTPPTFWTE